MLFGSASPCWDQFSWIHLLNVLELFGHESDITITVSYSIFIAATEPLKMFWILFSKHWCYNNMISSK